MALMRRLYSELLQLTWNCCVSAVKCLVCSGKCECAQINIGLPLQNKVHSYYILPRITHEVTHVVIATCAVTASRSLPYLGTIASATCGRKLWQDLFCEIYQGMLCDHFKFRTRSACFLCRTNGSRPLSPPLPRFLLDLMSDSSLAHFTIIYFNIGM